MSPQRSANITTAVILVLLAGSLIKGEVNREVVGQKAVKLTCSPTCSSRGYCFYSWFRDGVYLGCSYVVSVWFNFTSSFDEEIYSCRVNKNAFFLLNCELGEKQWDVTYTPDRLCALEGSSVDLICSYKHPEGLTVTKSFWFINEQPGIEPVDLLNDDQYKGRVQYYQTQTQCRMRITGLRASDARTYWFRFITDDPGGIYTIGSGVSLSVTGLNIEVLNTQGGGKQLICSSICTLTKPTYPIWYRNGQPLSDCSSASCSVAGVSGEDSYSCAAQGSNFHSPPVFPPKDTRAVVLPSGERVEGDSVTRTCISDANPPVLTFHWFKEKTAADESLGTDQNYSITSISSQHSGLYYCTALNQLGQQTSAPARLDVLFSDSGKQYVVWAAVGLVPALALCLLTAVLCVQRKRRAHRGTDVQTPKPGDDTYTTLNLTTTSPSEYETLTVVGRPPVMSSAPGKENN